MASKKKAIEEQSVKTHRKNHTVPYMVDRYLSWAISCERCAETLASTGRDPSQPLRIAEHARRKAQLLLS